MTRPTARPFGLREGFLISLTAHGALVAAAATVGAGSPWGPGSGSGSGSDGFEITFGGPGPGAEPGLLDVPEAEPTTVELGAPAPAGAPVEDDPWTAMSLEPLAWLGALPAAESMSPEPAPSGGTLEQVEPAGSGESTLAGDAAVVGGSSAGSGESAMDAAVAGESPAGGGSGAGGPGSTGPGSGPGSPGSGPGPVRTDPILVRSVEPAYPPASLRLGHEGRVLVRIFVSARGEVQDVELVETSGHEQLDGAAIDAVRAWRFRPATEDGVAVRGSLLHRVIFRIEDVS